MSVAGILRQLEWSNLAEENLFPRIKPLVMLLRLIACFPCCAQNLSEAKTEAASDFDLKFSNNDILVRPKGTDKWEHCRNVKEAIQVELPDGSHAYLITKAVKPPKPKHTPDADFPAQARNEHRDGMVAVHAIVDEHGTLRSVTVYSSSGLDFTTATMDVLRKWLFDPARLNDQPIAVLINITMSFHLSR